MCVVLCHRHVEGRGVVRRGGRPGLPYLPPGRAVCNGKWKWKGGAFGEGGVDCLFVSSEATSSIYLETDSEERVNVDIDRVINI